MRSDIKSFTYRVLVVELRKETETALYEDLWGYLENGSSYSI